MPQFSEILYSSGIISKMVSGEEAENVMGMYGKRSVEERRKYWKGIFEEKFKKQRWNVRDLRSDIAFYHKLISMWHRHKDFMEGEVQYPPWVFKCKYLFNQLV